MNNPSPAPRNPPQPTPTTDMRRYLVSYFRTVQDEYERVGYPFGATFEGMLLWFEFGLFTTTN